jgi:hypothetical protein
MSEPSAKIQRTGSIEDFSSANQVGGDGPTIPAAPTVPTVPSISIPELVEDMQEVLKNTRLLDGKDSVSLIMKTGIIGRIVAAFSDHRAADDIEFVRNALDIISESLSDDVTNQTLINEVMPIILVHINSNDVTICNNAISSIYNIVVDTNPVISSVVLNNMSIYYAILRVAERNKYCLTVPSKCELFETCVSCIFLIISKKKAHSLINQSVIGYANVIMRHQCVKPDTIRMISQLSRACQNDAAMFISNGLYRSTVYRLTNCKDNRIKKYCLSIIIRLLGESDDDLIGSVINDMLVFIIGAIQEPKIKDYAWTIIGNLCASKFDPHIAHLVDVGILYYIVRELRKHRDPSCTTWTTAVWCLSNVMYKRSPLLNIESIVVQAGALEVLEDIRDESLASIRNTDDAKAVNEMIAVLKSSIQTDAVDPHYQDPSVQTEPGAGVVGT